MNENNNIAEKEDSTKKSWWENRKGRYIDNPEERQRIWREAPRAKDKYGNELIQIGKYWCSMDYNRLLELAKPNGEEYIIVVRVSDGRAFAKKQREINRSKVPWRKRIDTRWYVFLDPITQQAY